MKSTKKKNKQNKITYGTVDLPPDEFEPKNVKFRVTMFVPLDVLDEIRKKAKAKDLPYQIYINQILRDVVYGDEEEKRIRKLIREELRKAS